MKLKPLVVMVQSFGLPVHSVNAILDKLDTLCQSNPKVLFITAVPLNFISIALLPGSSRELPSLVQLYGFK